MAAADFVLVAQVGGVVTSLHFSCLFLPAKKKVLKKSGRQEL
jgi:hypothetical protein